MERRGEKGTAAARARRPHGADQPSFSSTLLDAIYKSMDEPGHGAGVDAVSKKKKQEQEEALHYSYYYRPSLAGSYRARAPGPHATTTSSSSDCSSYGGFSSSEAETSSNRHRRLRPIRTAVTAPAPAPEKKASKKQPAGASIRAKLRDLRKAPASPGARLAGFLNTIFAGGGSKRAPQTPPSASTAAEYACSTASSASYSRSCLSKTPSTRGGQASRTVRFVDIDGGEAPATVPCRRMPVRAVEQMLLRRMEMDSDEEEEEEDEESSNASSDLFELENFTAAAAPPGAGGAGYMDELPVYETTRVVLNRGMGGHGYGHGRSARVV